MNQHLKSKSNLTMVALALILLITFAPLAMAAGPTAPYPSGYVSSAISIPGSTSQWTTYDFFSYLYEAFSSSHAQDGKAWLLYDANTQTAYVLVLANSPDWIGVTSAADTWVRIDGDTGGTKVSFTNFAWVNEGYRGSGTAEGYMASFRVTPGTHTIRIHLGVYAANDQTQTQKTAGTPGSNFPLILTPTNRIPITPLFGTVTAIVVGAGLFAAIKVFKSKRSLSILPT